MTYPISPAGQPSEPALWTAPPVEPPRPVLWSARRTAVAIVLAVGIGSLTAVTVSYADTGSTSTPTVGNGRLQRPGGGQFNGPPFGRGRFGNGQLGQFGNGQQGGPLPGGGQLGQASNGLPGGQ